MWNKLKSFFTGSTSSQNSEQNYQGDNFGQYNNQQYSQHNYNHNINLLKPADKNKKVVAVIVSFVSCSSYDHLFTSVEQRAEQGTQVLVYSCQSQAVGQISEAFTKQSQNQTLKQMITYIKQLDPDCVVFNWQCSSGYSSSKFNEGADKVIKFARMMIDRGHMVMFSDFSLKALISQWKQNILGPNPFVNDGQYGGNFTIQFNPQKLKDCPSAQLQIIGDMAAQGHCNVQAMGGTIVYGLDKKKADTNQYKLQVLTVVTSLKNNKDHFVSINGKQGQAGHVLLTYKSGGHLLVSMGHWIELMKIDTSQKVLFQVASRQFGQAKAQQMQMEYANLSSQSQKKQYISRNAVQFVQSQAPCANMSKKARNKY